jgi:hypothetical protein
MRGPKLSYPIVLAVEEEQEFRRLVSSCKAAQLICHGQAGDADVEGPEYPVYPSCFRRRRGHDHARNRQTRHPKLSP